MKIILASESPRRAKVMKRLQVPFEIKPSNFDEEQVKNLENNPAKLVETLALEKARSVARDYPQALVIGADTMAMIDGETVGKPKDLEDTRRLLLKGAGRKVKDFNGVAVVYKGQERSASVSGIAKMKNFGNKEIDHYFSRIDPLDKAGGFAADPAEGGEFLESYSGEPGQELGLPMNTLKRFLGEFGVKI
jgi:septum formation protein